jgi:hypothetical protein
MKWLTRCLFIIDSSHKYILAAMVLVTCSVSFARFQHQDANLIDADSNAGTEVYNDKLSYRWPLVWEDRWSRSHSGYRVGAGSLTMTRFDFMDEVRIDPRPLDVVSLAYEQDRREDFVAMSESREIRLGIRLVPRVRFLILGDGGAEKEFGDVGTGLRFFESDRGYLDLYGWSVDHYYNEKNHEQGAFRADFTRTYGVRGKRLAEDHGFGWLIRAERDLPLTWYRPLQGFYNYDRFQCSGQVDWRESRYEDWYVAIDVDLKNESRSDANSLSYLSLSRQSYIGEFGLRMADGAGEWDAGIQLVDRRVTAQRSGTNEELGSWTDRIPPLRSVRQEWGLVVNRLQSFLQGTDFQQGLVLNRPFLKEDERVWLEWELKYVTAVHWYFSESSSFGLNATWDLDQLAEDSPYSKRPFSPWGGGNIQAQVVF